MITRSLLLATLAVTAACMQSPEVACVDCSPIQLELLTTLGTEDGPGALSSDPSAIARDAKGRFYVVTPYMGEELPFVYDSRGVFVTRLGTTGSGPGEYLNPNFILRLPGDSMAVFDPPNARLTVLSPELESTRTIPDMPHVYSAALVSNGDIVVNNSRYPGQPFTRLKTDGTRLGSFGDSVNMENPAVAYLRVIRTLAPSFAGGTWTSRRFFRYEIVRWDSSGAEELILADAPDWFQPHSEVRNATPDLPATPSIWGIWEDSSGLWVVGRTSDSDWRNVLGEPSRVEGAVHYPVTSIDGAYDQVLELLDPVTGNRVASRRLDAGGQILVVEPGVVATVRRSETGWVFVDVWRVSFETDAV